LVITRTQARIECISWDIYHHFLAENSPRYFENKIYIPAPLPAPHFQKFECAQQLAKQRPTTNKSTQWLQQTQVAGRQVQVYHR